MTTFALAGTGAMAAVWARCIEATAGLQLRSVASRDPERARTLARSAGLAALTPAELPAGADITVVAGSPVTHARDATTVLRGGGAAVIEAPLCRTLAEADALVEAAAGGARLAYAENLLYAPLIRDALHRMAGLGRAHYVEARAVQAPNPTRAGHGRDWGGGVLFDAGPHLLAVVLVAIGDDRPVAVQATLGRAPSSTPDAVEDQAVLRLRFASGARAALDVRWAADGAQCDLQVATATSALRVELLPDPHVEHLGVDLPRPPRRRPDVEPAQLEQFGYLDQVAEVACDLTDPARGPWLTMAFGRSVLDIICAAYRSAATGTEEPLPFRGSRTATPWELWRTEPAEPGPTNDQPHP